ncbi:MAG TPA: helix-turn-helix domain-containing protein [Candidatus Limnocylindrales bacterium]|nr:helix-turn-helix domain-containing protein [Candidatus Limnocylindrales bacterium]
MSKHRVAVLKVVSGQLSVTAAAAECRISRQHLHRLLRRYREDGLDGLEPRSRRPHTSPHEAPDAVRDRIVSLDQPSGPGGRGHFRVRYDITDGKGAMTLRRAGRLHHLKVGAAHARRRVLAIVGEQEVTVVALDTGEILSAHRIEPAKGYWRNTRRDPGRWPGSQQTG